MASPRQKPRNRALQRKVRDQMAQTGQTYMQALADVEREFRQAKPDPRPITGTDVPPAAQLRPVDGSGYLRDPFKPDACIAPQPRPIFPCAEKGGENP